MTSESQIHLNLEIGKLLSNLKSDVREQIFRMSLEDTQDEKISMEDLLDLLPEPLLLEVLTQIQISDQNVSSPMFSLLKKFTDLSENSDKLREMLAVKLEDRKELFKELLTSRATRLFYPSSYRSLLDQELTARPTGGVSLRKEDSEGTDQSASGGEVSLHLSLIILELLEGPILSRAEYEGLVNYMDRLLSEGMGDKTQATLVEVLLLLFKKSEQADEKDRQFLRQEIKKFIKPEILTHLVQVHRSQGVENVTDLLGLLKEVAGDEVIPMLLDILEVEGNLSVRKRLLGLIVQYGQAVVPFALQRLDSDKWYVARNMLVLLRDLQAREALPHIARFMQHASPKMRTAALQAVESLGKGTDYFYQALSMALKDRDPSIFRKAVSMIISNRDHRALELITAQLRYSDKIKADTRLLTLFRGDHKNRNP